MQGVSMSTLHPTTSLAERGCTSEGGVHNKVWDLTGLPLWGMVGYGLVGGGAGGVLGLESALRARQEGRKHGQAPAACQGWGGWDRGRCPSKECVLLCGRSGHEGFKKWLAHTIE